MDSFVFQLLHQILPFVGIFSIIYGIYLLIEFFKDPKEAKKKAKENLEKNLKD